MRFFKNRYTNAPKSQIRQVVRAQKELKEATETEF